ncbi:DUF2103 domain-containing protein [Patescibacteria group bacterium]|nr:DUF2103 domain-containing protein [Patescibacteria group bacterium]
MKHRGRSHTTLTDTAKEVVTVLEKIPGVKMIAPGIIDGKRNASKRHITAVFTTAGMELIISGQGVQKVAVHTTANSLSVFRTLAESKSLSHFSFKHRERMPGR